MVSPGEAEYNIGELEARTPVTQGLKQRELGLPDILYDSVTHVFGGRRTDREPTTPLKDRFELVGVPESSNHKENTGEWDLVELTLDGKGGDRNSVNPDNGYLGTGPFDTDDRGNTVDTEITVDVVTQPGLAGYIEAKLEHLDAGYFRISECLSEKQDYPRQNDYALLAAASPEAKGAVYSGFINSRTFAQEALRGSSPEAEKDPGRTLDAMSVLTQEILRVESGGKQLYRPELDAVTEEKKRDSETAEDSMLRELNRVFANAFYKVAYEDTDRGGQINLETCRQVSEASDMISAETLDEVELALSMLAVSNKGSHLADIEYENRGEEEGEELIEFLKQNSNRAGKRKRELERLGISDDELFESSVEHPGIKHQDRKALKKLVNLPTAILEDIGVTGSWHRNKL